ncbi:hypothetical protein EGW08_010170 [Elysia chlorotica]|uniref:MARVEL domain-containing protein n=1 Tax=Elysia chlorotica TaxID=188477 RepID=A0A3S1BJ58_ELYCH|nr:hypothetical protein EGW08_010170 [Elysia chlorotica]
MADDRTGLLSGSRPAPPPAPQAAPGITVSSSSADAIYHDSSQTPRSRLVQVLFVALVAVMVVITLSLSIYRSIDVTYNGGMYFMLGVCLLGFVIIEILMIVFTRRGDLPKGKTWFLYFVGVCVLFEALFTDILLFQ